MKQESKIRLLVVDDHLIFRVGLIQSIQSEPDMIVVGEAATGPQAVQLYQQLKPDIVMMDLRLPIMDGVETIATICDEFANARIVVLTTYEGHEDIYRALQAGACGYLLKSVVREELVRAIRTVHAGQSYLPGEVAIRLAQRQAGSELSAREREILSLIVKGHSNKEIAIALHIAEVTVKVHVRHLLHKLNVSDRTQAVTAAIQRGIVHLD
jgi:DNA-binding NarL/FixJ family response regulator